jgi:hypothetical protein
MKQHAVMGGPQPAVLQEVSCGPACGPAGQFKLAWFAGPGSGGLSLDAHTPRDKNRAAAHATRDRARTPGGELQSICSETALPAPSSAVFSRRADNAGTAHVSRAKLRLLPLLGTNSQCQPEASRLAHGGRETFLKRRSMGAEDRLANFGSTTRNPLHISDCMNFGSTARNPLHILAGLV